MDRYSQSRRLVVCQAPHISRRDGLKNLTQRGNLTSRWASAKLSATLLPTLKWNVTGLLLSTSVACARPGMDGTGSVGRNPHPRFGSREAQRHRGERQSEQQRSLAKSTSRPGGQSQGTHTRRKRSETAAIRSSRDPRASKPTECFWSRLPPHRPPGSKVTPSELMTPARESTACACCT